MAKRQSDEKRNETYDVQALEQMKPAPMLMPLNTSQLDMNPGDVAVMAMQTQITQEIQASLVMAKSFPRDRERAFDRAMAHCKNLAFAEDAEYEYERGGTAITGPTIRLLEMLAREWGNVRYDWSILHDTPNEVRVRTYAWDLEDNVQRTSTFVVVKKRKAHNAFVELVDPRDVYEHVANMAARRLRTCLERVLPRDLIDEAVDQCHKTVDADSSDVSAKRRRLVEAFAEVDVTRKMLAEYLGHDLSEITATELKRLRRVYASIRDGLTSPEDVFGEAESVEASKSEAPKQGPEGAPTSADLLKGGDEAEPEPEVEEEPEPEPKRKPKRAPKPKREERPRFAVGDRVRVRLNGGDYDGNIVDYDPKADEFSVLFDDGDTLDDIQPKEMRSCDTEPPEDGDEEGEPEDDSAQDPFATDPVEALIHAVGATPTEATSIRRLKLTTPQQIIDAAEQRRDEMLATKYMGPKVLEELVQKARDAAAEQSGDEEDAPSGHVCRFCGEDVPLDDRGIADPQEPTRLVHVACAEEHEDEMEHGAVCEVCGEEIGQDESSAGDPADPSRRAHLACVKDADWVTADEDADAPPAAKSRPKRKRDDADASGGDDRLERARARLNKLRAANPDAYQELRKEAGETEKFLHKDPATPAHCVEDFADALEEFLAPEA